MRATMTAVKRPSSNMKQLLDFLPLILFFILYKFYMDLPVSFIEAANVIVPGIELTPGQPDHAIYLATFVTIAATVLQVGATILISRKLEKTPIITLALVIIFGSATLLLNNPLFIQWKPTAINWLFATGFLATQFIGEKPLVERMMAKAINITDRKVWNQLNLLWVGFFFFSGLANIIVAPQIDPLGLQFSEETWVEFKVFGLMAFTIVFILLQAIFIARYLPDANNKEEEIN